MLLLLLDEEEDMMCWALMSYRALLKYKCHGASKMHRMLERRRRLVRRRNVRTNLIVRANFAQHLGVPFKVVAAKSFWWVMMLVCPMGAVGGRVLPPKCQDLYVSATGTRRACPSYLLRIYYLD